MNDLGKLLIVLGAVVMAFGALLYFGIKWPRVPGDIHIVRENFSFHFPIVSSIIISVLATLAFWIFKKLAGP